MASLTVTSKCFKNMFNELHQYFGGNLTLAGGEYHLTFDNKFGKGQIGSIFFKGGILFLELDLTLKKNLKLITTTDESAPIYLSYCSNGKIGHRFKSEREKRFLENFQTGILTNRPYESNILYFDKDKHTKISVIVAQIGGNLNNNLKEYSIIDQLRISLIKSLPVQNSIYIGSYNLILADKIQQLGTIKHTGIVRRLMIEGLVYEILAYEIQQHQDDLKNKEMYRGVFDSKDLESIRKISAFIKSNLERSLCITELCSKAGLSPSKLQNGFKLLFGTTVTDYIRGVRLEQAENLIKNTNLTISEVVYSIGLTSRSYFSKIFKEKNNCCPKYYKVQHLSPDSSV